MLRVNSVRYVCFENISKQVKPVFLLLQSLAEKVYRTVASFFSKLNPWQNVRGFFSQREISLIQAIHALRAKQNSHKNTDFKCKRFKEFKIEQSPPEFEILENCKKPQYVYFDESLEDFRAFLREFCVLFVDIFYEAKIEIHVDAAQNMGSSIPNMIKSFATLLIEVGDKAAKPIFQKLSKQKAQTIDPALKKIFKMLIRPDPFLLREELSSFLQEKLKDPSLSSSVSIEDYISPVMQYATSSKSSKTISDFCSSDKKYDDDLLQKLCIDAIQFWDKKISLERSQLYEQLKLGLTDEFRSYAKQETDDDFITPILSWLILSDHSIPLAEVLDPLDLQKEIVTDKIFERSLELLVNRKIDQYSFLVERTLQKNLKEITLKTFEINADRISDFFSERVSELITSSSFSNTFDNLIGKVILPHIQGVNESHKLRSEHNALIDKAEKAVQLNSKDISEIEVQSKAKDYLDWINSHGNKEAFLKNILIGKYKELSFCTKNISDLIDQELKRDSLDFDQSVYSQKEKAVFSELADNILELILPSKTKASTDNALDSVDPLIELWERLYFPEEFQEIMKNFFKTTEEFINPETSSLFEIIKNPTIEIIKNIFKLYTREILKKQLIHIVEMSFQQLADPEHLIELFSLNLLPVINRKLLQLIISQYLARNLSKFAPYIHTLLTEDQSDHESNLHILQAVLIKDIKLALKDLKLEEFYISEKTDGEKVAINLSSLSEEDLLLLTKPLIQNFEDVVINSKLKKPFDAKNITLLEVKEIMQKYFHSGSLENNQIFGEIFTEIVFKTGEFPNEALINYFIKDSVSTEITGGLAPIRANHRYLVDTITSSLKSTFLNKSYLEHLIFGKPSTKPQFVEEKLDHQIKMTAGLAHHLILGIVQQKGTITTFAVKKYLTEKPAMLTNLITNIFNNLFRNYLINANLITAFSNEIFRSSPQIQT